nr:ribonuclease H-like domain-containing protein [Tanacetum cinerariifolium]
MEFESAQNNTTAKLPILKLVTKISVPVTAEEKINKKNDVKAGSFTNDVNTANPAYEASTVSANVNTASRQVSTANFSDNALTNDVNTANPAYEASTVSANVNTASRQVSTANFSDNALYAFMVENLNGSNLLQQDLDQIHEDDLEAMDLRWRLSLLCMRAKRYFQRTGKKIFINANDTAGCDKSKVECFHYHKIGHFAREYIAQRNQDGWFRNQENTKKEGNNEDTYSKAMLAIDSSLDKLTWSQITDNSKKGLGYQAVPPPHPLIYNGPTKLDLSYSGLDEFKEPGFKCYGPRDSKLESNINHDKKSDDSKENSNDSFVKKHVSEDTSSFVESPLNVDKGTTFLVDKKIKFVKPKHHDKPVRRSVRCGDLPDLMGKPQKDDKGFINSGCSRHMTGNIAYLLDFKEFDGGYVTFERGAHGGRISGKESLTCLVAKAALDESLLWHMRLGHINFKNINKLVQDNLVRGLPIKCFENDQTYVACLKEKQHKASCKS